MFLHLLFHFPFLFLSLFILSLFLSFSILLSISPFSFYFIILLSVLFSLSSSLQGICQLYRPSHSHSQTLSFMTLFLFSGFAVQSSRYKLIGLLEFHISLIFFSVFISIDSLIKAISQLRGKRRNHKMQLQFALVRRVLIFHFPQVAFVFFVVFYF